MKNNSPDIYTHLHICNLCEAMCGLKIETHQGEVLSIKGNSDDPFSKGHICAKAMALKDVHEDTNRLRQPIRRTDHGWEIISWEVAYKEIESELQSIQKKHGRDSISLYLGNPSYHHHGSLLSSILLKKSLNSRNCFSVASSDHLPHMLAAHQLFGHMAMLPVPDIDRTDYFLCIGANPLVSNGSVMGAPYIKKRLKSLKNRGGKLVTIDPRKTETAELADQHIFIQPGQDVYLLLGMIHFIFEHKLVNQGGWQKYTQGLAELEQLTQGFTLDKVAKKTAIDKETIKTLTEEFATAKKATAYGRFGICTQKNGSLNVWLIYVLNIITGNLDQPGGIMFPMPAADLALLSALVNEGGRFDKFRSPINNLPSFDSELPVIEMADLMLLKESKSIRAFINIAGNPVLSTPDGAKLEKALGRLDYMVSVDHYINETNRFANIILPPSSCLEKSQYNMTCNLTAVRNNARYSSPVFYPDGQTKHDWQIFVRLSEMFNREFSWRSFILRIIGFTFNKIGADGVLDLILRLGPYGYSFRENNENSPYHIGRFIKKIASISPQIISNKLLILYQVSAFSSRMRGEYWADNLQGKVFFLSLKNLKDNPNGIDFGPMRNSFPQRLFTTNKKINLVAGIYKKELLELDGLEGNISSLDNNKFMLIGRRTPRSMNSWLNKIKRLTKGKSLNNLLMHPDDAKAISASSGERVCMEVGEKHIYARVEPSLSIMKGVICLPHGWANLETNESTLDVSFNELTSSKEFDAIAGVSVLNNIQVRVYKEPLGEVD